MSRLRIESNPTQMNNQNVNEKKQKGTDIFEKLFNKNLKVDKESNLSLPIKENTLHISAKKLLSVEHIIQNSEGKKIITDLLNKLLSENKSKFKLDEASSKSLLDIKKQLLNGVIDVDIDITFKDLNNILKKLENIAPDSLSEEFSNELLKLIDNLHQAKDMKENSFIIEGKKSDLQSKKDGIVLEDKKNKIEEKHKDKEQLNTGDPFEELKKHRLETQMLDDKIVNASQDKNNWQVTSVKTDQLKIDDWIDSFKQEISKLADFRIENKQKVSMMLKEQGEQLRIVVEKKDSYIFIEANASDSMTNKLNSILSEVQNEMKEKGIEIRVDIKQKEEEEGKEKNNDENERESNENQHQGGKKDGRQRNQSNK